MANDPMSPADNYERNLLLVKRFGSKAVMIIIPLLMFFNIICMGYLSLTKNEPLEITLVKLLTTKFQPTIDFNAFDNVFMILSCIVCAVFIFIFISFFFSCKDPSYEAKPDFSLSLTYRWSMVQLILCAAAFVGSFIFLAMFIIQKPDSFESFADFLGMSVSDLGAYKVSIALMIGLACVIFAMLIWYSQSQTEFVKSIKLTLTNSVARNKGAHTFGVFSMTVSLALLCLAGIMTFIYYCYKDALNGFGISMKPAYVFVSLALAYIRGLIPFFIAVCALRFSEMVDEANTLGTIYYSDVDTYGAAVDPNMQRRKS